MNAWALGQDTQHRFFRRGDFDMALYDDIGGAPAVRAALDAFYPRVLADTTLSPFFAGVCSVRRWSGWQELAGC